MSLKIYFVIETPITADIDTDNQMTEMSIKYDSINKRLVDAINYNITYKIKEYFALFKAVRKLVAIMLYQIVKK